MTSRSTKSESLHDSADSWASTMRYHMFRWFSFAGLLLIVAAADDSAARADDVARRVQTGSLESGDVRLSSGEYIDEFPLEGKAGQFVIIELHSAEFNAFLQMAPGDGSGPLENLEWHNNDMRAANTDACLAVTLPADGEYNVYVTSAGARETGRYELALTVLPGPGRTEQGALTEDDRKLMTGEFCDYYDFEAKAGEIWVIDVTSSDFDTYLFGRSSDNQDYRVDNNDAFGEERHSQVILTIAADGRYFVGVTSSQPGEKGAYEIRLSSTTALTTTDQRPAPGHVERGARNFGLPEQRAKLTI